MLPTAPPMAPVWTMRGSFSQTYTIPIMLGATFEQDDLIL